MEGRSSSAVPQSSLMHRSPTVSRPTSLVPAMEVFTTGMWSASSASKTLRCIRTARHGRAMLLTAGEVHQAQQQETTGKNVNWTIAGCTAAKASRKLEVQLLTSEQGWLGKAAHL